ncbi:MAG: hypothetical protein AAAC47_17770 [Pararhizobium sp.]
MLIKQAHIAGEEVFLQPEKSELPIEPQLLLADHSARARARLRRELLQKELELLRARLDVIRAQAKDVVRLGATWANASARAQLGPYPWATFAGIAVSSFLVTNAIRKLPLGTVVATSMPLIMAAIERRRSHHG